jgi:type IV fimbrial biogenesis protein FimT
MHGRNAKGFTLLEILLVLVIISTLVISSIYGWRAWETRQQRLIALHTLQDVLVFAKQTALIQNEQVTICAAASDTLCGEDWSKGMLVFFDPNNSGQPHDSKLLMRVPALTGKQAITIRWQGWLKHTFVRFMPDGTPHSYHGTFYWIEANTETPILVINAAGRIREVA